MKEIILDNSLEINDGRDFPELHPQYFFGFQNENLEAVTTIDAQVVHRNYLDYLSECWNRHYGVIVSPTILWNMVLANLAYEVNKNPETYRKYFTESDEKVEIVVDQGGYLISVDLLISSVKGYMPTEIMDHTFPDFTTNSESSQMANYTAFLDMVSPYYNYSMLLCGIPKVTVMGTDEDWALFRVKCDEISILIPEFEEYLLGVRRRVAEMRHDDAVWENFFSLQRCGSGSQVEVSGWIRDFFIEQPRIPYPENFISCISKIDYACLNNGKNYRLYAGLFTSEIADGYLIPDFDHMYFEVKKEE